VDSNNKEEAVVDITNTATEELKGLEGDLNDTKEVGVVTVSALKHVTERLEGEIM
jgi:hypothetical protein